MSAVRINGKAVELPASERIVQADHPRPRGFAPYKPQQKARELIEAALAVLEQYQAQLPLSNRQIYYVLVAGGHLDKTETEGKRLGDVMNRARRGGLISFND